MEFFLKGGQCGKFWKNEGQLGKKIPTRPFLFGFIFSLGYH
jgi:hypothetical protein